MLGLPDWSHAAIYCVLCVGLPHCQHSAAPLLFSGTETLAPSVYKTVYSNVFVLLRKITRCVCGGSGGRGSGRRGSGD